MKARSDSAAQSTPSASAPARSVRRPHPALKLSRSSLAALAVAGGALGATCAPAATFEHDVAFLKDHVEVIVLADPSGLAQVALVPAYQGRVMTSTAAGVEGLSFGWINRELIAAKKVQPHINVFGGEDRFWLGPEGGQYAIFFAKGVPFDLEHWFTPAAIDTEPFELVKSTRSKARFRHRFSLTNYSGATFDVEADREIKLLSARKAWRELGVRPVKDVNLVAYESVNRIKNKGKEAWTKESGLLSIWILGMYNPSPATTVVIPIKDGPESELGKPVNADYFGPVPADRLAIKNGVVFFSGDGKSRGKIGINPRRAKPVLGSYDAQNKVLTIVQYTLPKGATDYVNSMWELQKNPYGGDVVNSYNDGPPEPGAKPLGPFYEIESSSPAAALKPGKSLKHVHRTIHLTGAEAQLDPVAQAVLGVSLHDIVSALKQ